MKILIIEDEKDLLESMSQYLENEGFVVESANNFSEADMKSDIYEYDCLVVDITLPDGSGLDIIREMKQSKPDTGIIIVSAKDSLDDRLEGLDIGADDYLTKPFHLSELNARINSIIRRRNFAGNTEIQFNEIKVLPENKSAQVNDDDVELTRKEYDLLEYFIANKDRVVTKEALAEHVWGDNIDMADSFDFMYTHIKNLRKKLMDKGAPDYIQTVYGVGYKFGAA